MRATGYNQVRDDEKLLQEYELYPPSFSVRLYPSYWTLNNGNKFLYNMPVSSLLEDIRAYRIPPDFVELFEEAKVPYYDGCLIVELLDYRPQKAKDPILEDPDKQRVVLRSNPESVWADICQMKQRLGAAWTDEDALDIEARILLATSHPLCLEPDPHLTRVVNSVIRVSTPTMPNSLKRKATAMVDVEEDETEKAKRAKILQFMNPQASRAAMPIQPSFRILALIEKRMQEGPAPPQPLVPPQMARPPSTSAFSPVNNALTSNGASSLPAPPVAPAITTVRSGSFDDSGGRSAGTPALAQPVAPLPLPSAVPSSSMPIMPASIPIPIQVPRQIPDPNLRKSPVKRPTSSASQSMPPPQNAVTRQPSPNVFQAANPTQQPQPPRPPSRHPEEQSLQSAQTQMPSVQASPQPPNASFKPPIPPATFLNHPPPAGKRRQSHAKPPTPAMATQALPQQSTTASQGASSPVTSQTQRSQPQAQAMKAYAQLQASQHAQHAHQVQMSAQMRPMAIANAAQQRQLSAGRSTPITQPGTPQQSHAVLNRSPIIPSQSQQSGRSSPMISGQQAARSSPLVSNQAIPQRAPIPQVGPQQAQAGASMLRPPTQMSMAQAQYMNHIRSMAMRAPQQMSQLQGQPTMFVQAQGQQQGHPQQLQQQTDQTGSVPQQHLQPHPQMSMYAQPHMLGYPYWLQGAQPSGQQQIPMVPGVPVQQLQNIGRSPLTGNLPNNMPNR